MYFSNGWNLGFPTCYQGLWWHGMDTNHRNDEPFWIRSDLLEVNRYDTSQMGLCLSPLPLLTILEAIRMKPLLKIIIPCPPYDFTFMWDAVGSQVMGVCSLLVPFTLV